MTPMNNNPVFALMQIAKNGGNPMRAIQQLAGRDPRAAQAMKLMQGKNPQQLQQMAENMAKERGIDLNQMASQMGIELPREK